MEKLILVTGSTGMQGGAVARRLLASGRYRVRALTRNPAGEAGQRLRALGAEVVGGDLDDHTSLLAAAKGAQGVFAVLNYATVGDANTPFPDKLAGEERQGKALAQACKEAGVDHYVYSSVGGVDRLEQLHPVQQFVMRGKRAIEEHVRALGIASTILRPTWIMDNFALNILGVDYAGQIRDGRLSLPLPAATHMQMIAADDIAAFVELAFDKPSLWLGRAVEIAGDDITGEQAAAVFSERIGQPVRFEQLQNEMGWVFEQGHYRADIEALRREHPTMLTLRAWAATAFV